MSEKMSGIIFLVVTGLLILGFIYAIIFTIIKKITSKSNIKQLAAKYKWIYFKNDTVESKELKDFIKGLENELYSSRSGLKQNVFNIIKGNYNNINFWFSYYHSASINHMAGKGYSEDLSIYVLPRLNPGSKLFMLYKTKIMKALPVTKIAEKLGEKLEAPTNPEIDWLLVSNADAFAKFGYTIEQFQAIHQYFKELFAIYLLDNSIIYMFKQYKNTKDILKYLDFIYKINSILNN